MIDYAILDTSFLLNPSDSIIDTLYIPFSIIFEFKTQEFLLNFKSIKQKYKIIYTHNKLITKTSIIDDTEEILILDTRYYTFSEYICKQLNVLCSKEDQQVIATTLYLESIYNHNECLFELINFFQDQSDIEKYLKEIEKKEFSEWKSFNNPVLKTKRIIKCLAKDAGINTIFSFLKLNHVIYAGKTKFIENQFVLRCFTCKTIYKKERMFCSKCGNKTITRVSVRRDENNRLVVNLKKGFKFKPKIIKDRNGKEILSEDSRQWKQINNKK